MQTDNVDKILPEDASKVSDVLPLPRYAYHKSDLLSWRNESLSQRRPECCDDERFMLLSLWKNEDSAATSQKKNGAQSPGVKDLFRESPRPCYVSHFDSAQSKEDMLSSSGMTIRATKSYFDRRTISADLMPAFTKRRNSVAAQSSSLKKIVDSSSEEGVKSSTNVKSTDGVTSTHDKLNQPSVTRQNTLLEHENGRCAENTSLIRGYDRRIGSGRILSQGNLDFASKSEGLSGEPNHRTTESLDYSESCQENATGSNSHKGNIYGRNIRNRKGLLEPEWLRCGPTSRDDCIELGGFETIELNLGTKSNEGDDLCGDLKTTKYTRLYRSQKSDDIIAKNEGDIQNVRENESKRQSAFSVSSTPIKTKPALDDQEKCKGEPEKSGECSTSVGFKDPDEHSNGSASNKQARAAFKFDDFLVCDPFTNNISNDLCAREHIIQNEGLRGSKFSQWFKPQPVDSNFEKIHQCAPIFYGGVPDEQKFQFNDPKCSRGGHNNLPPQQEIMFNVPNKKFRTMVTLEELEASMRMNEGISVQPSTQILANQQQPAINSAASEQPWIPTQSRPLSSQQPDMSALKRLWDQSHSSVVNTPNILCQQMAIPPDVLEQYKLDAFTNSLIQEAARNVHQKQILASQKSVETKNMFSQARRMPTKLELQQYTQNIMQNAILKRSQEKPQENYQHIQKLQEQHHFRNTAKAATPEPSNTLSDLVFTNTSMRRNMSVENQYMLGSGQKKHNPGEQNITGQLQPGHRMSFQQQMRSPYVNQMLPDVENQIGRQTLNSPTRRTSHTVPAGLSMHSLANYDEYFDYYQMQLLQQQQSQFSSQLLQQQGQFSALNVHQLQSNSVMHQRQIQLQEEQIQQQLLQQHRDILIRSGEQFLHQQQQSQNQFHNPTGNRSASGNWFPPSQH